MNGILLRSSLVVDLIDIGIAGILGLMFLFRFTPKSEDLTTYRRCCKYLTIAYLSTVILNISGILIQDLVEEVEIYKYLVFVKVSLQTLFLTIVFRALAITSYNKNKILLEFAVLIIFIILTTIVNSSDWMGTVKTITFLGFLAFFVLQNMRQAHHLYFQKKEFDNETLNNSSGLKSNKLLWISIAVYRPAFYGIIAIIWQLTSLLFLMVLFEIICMITYSLMGIKYLEYLYTFQFVPANITEKQGDNPISSNTKKEGSINSLSYAELERALNKWLEDKNFMNPGVTMEDMAVEFGTNRTYLSTYINNEKGMNFCVWINYLRVEEAKKLILEQPDLSIMEISERVGYLTQSHFGKQFLKLTGQTPLVWRQTNYPTANGRGIKVSASKKHSIRSIEH